MAMATPAISLRLPSGLPLDTVRAQSEDFADAIAFLNGSGGYGADIPAARKLHPGLTSFETWLATAGGARISALLDRHSS
ncbi:hypothetical protein [Nonomuraea turcica]|uniref:hypothetical protein n=1 Tax=Nonomuraea sp. G32 TaxID=3067274 RepID=UPI00273CB737|nr:hypothetical protein [Nonomuraea sp. G32]MDP4505319.1 hypothetical protein [Nonomuraea sp. G32]